MAFDPALPIFPFRPDWTAGVSERLGFRTEALQSRAGYEQTRALLQAPRRTFEFTITAEGVDRQLLNSRLWNTRGGEWYLPIPTDAVTLAEDLAAGLTSVAIGGAERDFTDGGVVIFRDPETLASEAFELSYSPGSLSSIGSPSARTWPAGTLIFPARRARLDGDIVASAFTAGFTEARVRLRIAEACDWPAIAPAATYREFPVLTIRPHTLRDPEVAYALASETVDEGLGPVSVFDYVGQPLPVQTHDFWLKGREAISELRSVLYYLKGRNKSIWVPTWLDDLTIAEPIGGSSTALRVAHCEFTANLAAAGGRKDIRIELRSGAVYYRRVTAASVVSETVEQLTLSSALGVAAAVNDVQQISFLNLSRSNADLFNLDWWTNDFCEVATAWRGRKHDF